MCEQGCYVIFSGHLKHIVANFISYDLVERSNALVIDVQRQHNVYDVYNGDSYWTESCDLLVINAMRTLWVALRIQNRVLNAVSCVLVSETSFKTTPIINFENNLNLFSTSSADGLTLSHNYITYC